MLSHLPALVRLYIINVLIGFLLAIGFTAMLIGFDVAGLRHLVLAVQGGWLAVLMLVVFNTIVFAGVQFGIAVMGMARPTRGPGSGMRIRALLRPNTRPVAAPAGRRK